MRRLGAIEHRGLSAGAIAAPGIAAPRAFMLRVVGDSMCDEDGDLSFRDGDFIVVDPDRQARHRSMVAVRPDEQGGATFRQLLIESDGTKVLQALNPACPIPTIRLTERSTICGVVVGKWVAQEE